MRNSSNTRVNSVVANQQAFELPEFPHTESGDAILQAVAATRHGLDQAEAAARLSRYGRNTLPTAKPPGLSTIFFHQFASPLIYVLAAAAVLSVAIREWSDAGFIAAVLLINALIGTYQEHSAQRAAEALRNLVTSRCRVLRSGESRLISAEELVPGDIVLLESGEKIAADMRLLDCRDLEVDESMLTGESVPVTKDEHPVLPVSAALGDHINMAFAGTLVTHGRARGVVVHTAMNTALGRIAADVLFTTPPKAPLQVRMDKFVHRVALFVLLAAAVMLVVAVSRGMPLGEMFLLAVALAVSVIPEGLPVALTVALAIGMHRMSTRNVIVRRLLAVEALGSCTFIATDKTGTLTVNQLTVRRLIFPNQESWSVSGEGSVPEGEILSPRGIPMNNDLAQLHRLCRTAVLTNEAYLAQNDGGWSHHGDAVDVAMLVMAHKANIIKAELVNHCPEIANIPYESEQSFSASLNQVKGEPIAHVKGATERLVSMCSTMALGDGDKQIDASLIESQATSLAAEGYRVLALASGKVELQGGQVFSEEHLHQLTFLGLVGIIDPLRREAKDSVIACHRAGIEVAMVTGDHPATALAIARELGLAESEAQVVTGPQLKQALDLGSIDELTARTRVFARVGPHQKLHIIESLQRHGHFVAVSGDGVNDAPALRAAQVGVAMGKSGTDVAKETSALVVTDDNFASIVSGVEEGRVAYANVRKVIFLLVSTGAAELVLFTLALLSSLPLPLIAVQLLWLNLVTNGIQDVALAFEPAEGDELSKPPRSPKEAIFNRLMIERVVISALVIGFVAFALFQWLLDQGYTVDQARNGTLLLMVLFENVHVFNSRSETRSIFRHNIFGNKILLIGTLVAQLVHIAAMYTPWIKDVLHIEPVSPEHWLQLLGLALTILVAMEVHKLFWSRNSWSTSLPYK